MTDVSHKKILVIKLGALGDFIQALGPMASIRKHHENAEIILLTTKSFENFAKECGYFDKIWIDEKPKFFDLMGWISLKKRLNKEKFERVYDLQNNDRTSFYFRLFNNKKDLEWVGTAKGASHRNMEPERTAGHAFDGHVQTLALAGIRHIEVDTLEWMKASISCFPLRKPYVLIVPGSAPEHPQKRWPVERYSELANTLSQWDYQPVIIGTGIESEIAESITKNCSEALDLTGQTSLQEIAVLARGAAAAIGNDTGPIHLIAATGCPVLVLFSEASNAKKHAPKGRNIKIIQKHNLQDLKMGDVIKNFKPRENSSKLAATMH